MCPNMHFRAQFILIQIIFKAEKKKKKTLLPFAVHDYAWHFNSTYSEKAGGQTNWQAGEWIMEKSLRHLDTNYPKINNKKSIDAGNYWQTDAKRPLSERQCTVSDMHTDRWYIKEKRKLSEKKMQSSSHSLIFMMGPLSASHMPKMRLSLLSCFHLFIAFFQ